MRDVHFFERFFEQLLFLFRFSSSFFQAKAPCLASPPRSRESETSGAGSSPTYVERRERASQRDRWWWREDEKRGTCFCRRRQRHPFLLLLLLFSRSRSLVSLYCLRESMQRAEREHKERVALRSLQSSRALRGRKRERARNAISWEPRRKFLSRCCRRRRRPFENRRFSPRWPFFLELTDRG